MKALVDGIFGNKAVTSISPSFYFGFLKKVFLPEHDLMNMAVSSFDD